MTNRAGWVVSTIGRLLFALFLVVLSTGCQSSLSSSQPSASATLEVRLNGDSNSPLPNHFYEPEVQSQIARLMSEGVRHDVLKAPEVQATTWYRAISGNAATAQDEFGTMLSTESEPGTGLIHLTLHADDGEEAKTILTQWIVVFLREVEHSQDNRAERARLAYQAEHDTALQDIAHLKADIQAHEIRNPQAIIEERLSDNTRTLLLLTDQRNEAMADLAGAQAYSDMMLRRSEAETSEPTRDEIETIEQSVAVRDLRAQIQELEQLALFLALCHAMFFWHGGLLWRTRLIFG